MTATDRNSLGESPKIINEHMYVFDGARNYAGLYRNTRSNKKLSTWLMTVAVRKHIISGMIFSSYQTIFLTLLVITIKIAARNDSPIIMTKSLMILSPVVAQ